AQKSDKQKPRRAPVFTWLWKSLWIMLVHFLFIGQSQTQVEVFTKLTASAVSQELNSWTQPILNLVISPRANFVELDPEFLVYLDVYEQIQMLEREAAPARPSRGIASETA